MRLFTEGAEMRDTSFWDVQNAMTIVAGPISPYAYSLGGQNLTCYRYFTDTGEGYFRSRVYTNIVNNTSLRMPTIRKGTTSLIYVSSDGAGMHWCVGVSGSIVASSTVLMVASVWYLVELYFKIDNAPNGRITLYVDGNLLIDYTGDTQPGADTTADNVFFNSVNAGGAVLSFDDLALNNTSNVDGKNDNSWCGEGVVNKVYPDGDGSTNDWFNSAGDHVNNWSYVDEFPHTSDIDYVYHDASISGHQDQYALSHLSFSGKTILRIYAEARCRKTAAVARTVKIGTLASGGADVMSSGDTLEVATYKRYVGPEAKVNPVDNNPWEEADIDALEFVVETG
jgi:hypothetical protein